MADLIHGNARRRAPHRGRQRTPRGRGRHELRNLRIDDFTPLVLKPDLEQGWRRMLETGVVTSDDSSEVGWDYLGVTNYSVAPSEAHR